MSIGYLEEVCSKKNKKVKKVTSSFLYNYHVRYGNESVTVVNNGDFTRVDRNAWAPNNLTQEDLAKKYDAHLPGKIYLPANWNRTLPLLKLMYGVDSVEVGWASTYASDFYATVRNFVEFNY